MAEGTTSKVDGSKEPGGCKENAVTEEDLEDWDPRVADYNSVQNLIGVDASNEGAFILGTKGFQTQQRAAEIPCKFPVTSSGFCWKGALCPYLHNPHALTREYFEDGKQVVVSLENLDKPTELVEGGIFSCIVTELVNFSEIYVVPASSLACHCEHVVGPASYRRKDPNCTYEPVNRDYQSNRCKGAGMNVGENDNFKSDVPKAPHLHREGYEALKRLETQMNFDLKENRGWRKLQDSVYAQTEMVAVLRAPGLWERGVVLNENANNSIGREIPHCKVRLIDRGPVVTVSASNMCSLPQKYCNLPPLAIKCCLSKIVPIRYTWLKQACMKWRSILLQKKVLLIVRQAPSPETRILPVMSENEEEDLSSPIAPYLVDLIITPELAQIGMSKEVTTNQYLSDILVELGLAIKTSSFPYRPELENRYGSRTVEELLLADQKNVAHKPNIDDELRELSRFKTMLEIESHEGPSPNYADVPQSCGLPPSCSEFDSFSDPPSVATENGDFYEGLRTYKGKHRYDEILDVRVDRHKVLYPSSFEGVNPSSFLTPSLGCSNFVTDATPTPRVKANLPVKVPVKGNDRRVESNNDTARLTSTPVASRKPAMNSKNNSHFKGNKKGSKKNKKY